MNAPVRMLALAVLLPAASARAEPDAFFPPAIPSCYVGAEITPAAAGAPPYRKPAVPVTAVRLERGYSQLAHEETRPAEGDRLINLRVIVTFADAGRPGMPKRYSSGRYELLRCTADLCDANNYKVERQADGTVLLRMTGGLFVGAGTELNYATRHLPDGHVYRLMASPTASCR